MSASSDRTAMARGLALLYGAGATLVTITLLLPHREGEAQLGLLIPVGCAVVVVTALLTRPQWFAPELLSVILGLGSLLIGVCVNYGGPAGGLYAFMYVWVALYAAAFFGPRETGVHLGWASVSYIAVLVISEDVRPPAGQWLMAAGTSAIAATLILSLMRELRARAQVVTAVTALANQIGSAIEVSAEELGTAVCAGAQAATGAASVVMLEELPDGSGLRVIGSAGSAEAAAAFEQPAGIAALDEAWRSGDAQLLPIGSAIGGIVSPVRRDGRVGGLLKVVWQRPRRRMSARLTESVSLFAAEAGVALERVGRQDRDRERRALELNDAIVQGLVVAKYALRDGRVQLGAQAVNETLDRARALVDDQLEELHGEGAPEPGSLRLEGRDAD
jgi:hypothetical protein